MTIFNSLNKKVVSGMLIVSLIAISIMPVFSVKKAQAVFGVEDTVEFGPATLTFMATMLSATNPAAAAALDTAAQVMRRTIIDTVIGAFYETLRIGILNYITYQAVSGIQGGPEGGIPEYVQNPKEVLRQAASRAGAVFLTKTKLTGLCEPFNFQIRASLQDLQRDDTFNACTLNVAVGNIRAFYNDFRSGGWYGFTSMMEDQNNPYGATMNINFKRLAQIAADVKNAQNRMDIGSGYLGPEGCAYGMDQGGKDTDGDGAVNPNCFIKQIKMPGAAVGARLQKALNIDIEGVLSAQEFTQIIAFVVNSAMGQALANLLKSGDLSTITGGGGDGWKPPTMPVVVYVYNPTYKSCIPAMEDEKMKSPSYPTFDQCVTANEEKGNGGDGGTPNENTKACSAGVFVAGQPIDDCVGNTCPRCVGIGGESAKDCCFVFCMHTKGVNWIVNGAAQEFAPDDVKSVCNFFGLPVPTSNCVCKGIKNELPYYKNPDVGEFTKCSACSDDEVRVNYLCKKTEFCDDKAQ